MTHNKDTNLHDYIKYISQSYLHAVTLTYVSSNKTGKTKVFLHFCSRGSVFVLKALKPHFLRWGQVGIGGD